MRSPNVKMLLLALCLGAPAASQDLTPPRNDIRPQSLQDLRGAIAWYGAYCVMNAAEIEQYGTTFTLPSIAAETGVPLAQIEAVAQARGAEHAIAVAVLRAGGEPLQDPPEPFLSMLRQTQSDCQEYERSRRVLEHALARGDLPEVAPVVGTPLRAALDPLPFDRDRATRMGFVLAAVDDVRAAGVFEVELLALAQVISGRAALTLYDIAGITDPQERRWIAAELLLPDPDTVTDLTREEAAELVARVSADPEGALTRYYASLLIANLETLGEDILSTGTGEEVFFFRETGPVTQTCRRLANSAALRCDPQ